MPARRAERQDWGSGWRSSHTELCGPHWVGKGQEAPARSWETPKWAVTVIWVTGDEACRAVSQGQSQQGWVGEWMPLEAEGRRDPRMTPRFQSPALIGAASDSGTHGRHRSGQRPDCWIALWTHWACGTHVNPRGEGLAPEQVWAEVRGTAVSCQLSNDP